VQLDLPRDLPGTPVQRGQVLDESPDFGAEVAVAPGSTPSGDGIGMRLGRRDASFVQGDLGVHRPHFAGAGRKRRCPDRPDPIGQAYCVWYPISRSHTCAPHPLISPVDEQSQWGARRRGFPEPGRDTATTGAHGVRKGISQLRYSDPVEHKSTSRGKHTMEPALVLGSHTVGLGVARALGRQGVPVIAVYHDDMDHGYVSKYVRKSIRVPHPEAHEDEFIQSLVDCAESFGGGVLIPTSDATLASVSRHKNLLERHYIVACTTWDTARLFIDKKYTYALADEVGVPAPRTVVPHSVEDVEQYAQRAEYPCLVKPSQSHQYFDVFRRKMVKVDDFDQMLAAYQEATDQGFEVMLQEFIPGDDSPAANYNSYVWDGEALVEFTAAKIRSAPRETGSPCCNLSAHIPEVVGPGRKILQAMGFYGFACTEFKRDARDGVYKLMEVNGRHNLSTLLAVRCGINFPWIQYEHLVHRKVPTNSEYETGVYWIDLLRDASALPEYVGRRAYTAARWLEPYRHPHVFAIRDRDDPRPWRRRCTALLRSRLQPPTGSQ
jgi:D-aspartate ligase